MSIGSTGLVMSDDFRIKKLVDNMLLWIISKIKGEHRNVTVLRSRCFIKNSRTLQVP